MHATQPKMSQPDDQKHSVKSSSSRKVGIPDDSNGSGATVEAWLDGMEKVVKEQTSELAKLI